MKIKMSDVFGDKNPSYLPSMTDAQVRYMDKATRAYDANQELISRYQKLVCQTCDGHGAVGNILDSMDCPDCTALGNAQEVEIAELKSQCSEEYNKCEDTLCRLEVAKNEISELKAQISSIKRLADGLMDSKSGIDYSGKMDGLLDAIDKAPPQCLADVKADAGKAGFYEGFSRSGQGFNDEYGCEPIELETMAELYVNELREGKSCD